MVPVTSTTSESGDNSKWVFLDTNIWIHFIPVEDIDWNEVVGCAIVHLVVPPVVIDELDKLKDSGRTRRIKDRARSALKKIENWDETPAYRVRNGVSGVVWVPQRLPNFVKLGLDQSRADDLLLGTILVFREENPDRDSVLITADTGPRIKAKRLAITTITPPESMRIEEPDAAEVENQKLTRELTMLKSRAPLLSVRLSDLADGGVRIEFPGNRLKPPPRESFIKASVERARKDAPQIDAPAPPASADVAKPDPKTVGLNLRDLILLQRQITGSVSKEEYSRYAKDRENYLQAVEAYAASNWNRIERTARSLNLSFFLRNDGTAIAEDTDVYLHFPDGPSIAESREEKPIEIPKPPAKPRTDDEVRMDLFRNIGQFSPIVPYPHFPNINVGVPNVSSPRIKPSKSVDVTYHVMKVKHHGLVKLGELTLEFPSLDRVASLTIGWRVRSATLPDIVSGELHVVVRN